LITVVELTGRIVNQTNKVDQILLPNWVVNVPAELEMDFGLNLARKGRQGKLDAIIDGVEIIRDCQHLSQTLKL
jgi:hypothetical protein